MDSDFLPYGRHQIDESDIRAVVDVLRHSWLTQGSKVEEFEDLLAARLGSAFAVVCSSGTAALHLAMLAAGVSRDDEVICPAVTFAASSNSALYVGARPRFADIDYHTVCIDPCLMQAAISEKTRAIVPVHFAGLAADMPSISKIARAAAPQALIIEDACHALGARHADGSPVGSLTYGDIAVFSFHPVKHIATGEGGAILTNSKPLAERLRLFRSHGITRQPERLDRTDEGPWYYEMQELGFNYRLPDLNCALGISQMAKLSRFTERRREIASRYQNAFRDLPMVEIPADGLDTGRYHSWHIYVLRIDFDRIDRTRSDLARVLNAEGIGTQVHYYPVPLQPYYRRSFGFAEGEFPAAEKHYKRALTIPLYPAMTDSDVDRVIETIHRVLAG